MDGPEDPITDQDHFRIVGEHLESQQQHLRDVAERAASTAAETPDGEAFDAFRRVNRRIEILAPGLEQVMELLQEVSSIGASPEVPTAEEFDHAEQLLAEARAAFDSTVRRALFLEE